MLALSGEDEASISRTTPGNRGRQGNKDAGLAGGVVKPQRPLVKLQAANLDARTFVLLAAVQQPVLAALCVPGQKDHRAHQPHFGKHQVSQQQLRHVQRDVNRIGSEHLLLLGPGRVGKRHATQIHLRPRPAPAERQVTTNHQRPASGVQSQALKGRAQPVQAQQRDHQCHQGQGGQQGAADPPQSGQEPERNGVTNGCHFLPG